MRSRYKAAAAAVIAVASAAVFTSTQIANASTTDSPAVASIKVEQAFDVTGFDAAVAKAHGYKKVTYANGSWQVVPVNSKSGLKASPILPAVQGAASPDATVQTVQPDGVSQNTVYGTCGYSYIEGEMQAVDQIWLTSGFNIAQSGQLADSVSWTIELEDNTGKTTYVGDASALTPPYVSWSHTWNNITQHGYSYDNVLTSSYALLDNGEICTSGGPHIEIAYV